MQGSCDLAPATVRVQATLTQALSARDGRRKDQRSRQNRRANIDYRRDVAIQSGMFFHGFVGSQPLIVA